MLEDILNDVVLRSEEGVTLQESRQSSNLFSSHRKDLLESNIRLLIGNLEERAASTGWQPKNALPLQTAREKHIVDYVVSGNVTARSRPDSSSSRPRSSRSMASNSSIGSNQSLEDKEVTSRMNIDEIETILGELKRFIEHEREELLEGIEELQQMCEQENNQLKDAIPAPTVGELQALNRKLEKELLSGRPPPASLPPTSMPPLSKGSTGGSHRQLPTLPRPQSHHSQKRATSKLKSALQYARDDS